MHRDFLVVQWLESTSNAGDVGSVLVGKLISHASGQLSPCTAPVEPVYSGA